MKKIIFTILFVPGILFSAEVQVQDLDNIRVPNSEGVLHHAGNLENVISSYPEYATDVRAAVKTFLQQKLMTKEEVQLKITRSESSGVTLTSPEKASIVNSKPAEYNPDKTKAGGGSK